MDMQSNERIQPHFKSGISQAYEGPESLEHLEELETKRRFLDRMMEATEYLRDRDQIEYELAYIDIGINFARRRLAGSKGRLQEQVLILRRVWLTNDITKLKAIMNSEAFDHYFVLHNLLGKYVKHPSPVLLGIAAKFIQSLGHLLPEHLGVFNEEVDGFAKLISTVLEINPDLMVELKNYMLWFASKKGFIQIVDALMKDEQVDPSSFGDQALLDACSHGHFDTAKLLLSDSRVNASAGLNYCLRRAARKGCCDLVKTILKCSTFKPDRHASEAFLEAIFKNELAIFKILLKDGRIGIPLNRHQPQNDAFLLAIKHKRQNMVGYLLAEPAIPLNKYADKFIGGENIKEKYLYLVPPMLFNMDIFKFIQEYPDHFPKILNAFPEILDNELDIENAFSLLQYADDDSNALLLPFYKNEDICYDDDITDDLEQALESGDSSHLLTILESGRMPSDQLRAVFLSGKFQNIYRQIDEILGQIDLLKSHAGPKISTESILVILAQHMTGNYNGGDANWDLILKYLPYIASGGPMNFLSIFNMMYGKLSLENK